MNREDFKKLQNSLPNLPGIYKYYNSNKELIYVGKAINIRKRVSSYFTGKSYNNKTSELVQKITSIEFTIVDNEHNAFLLENSLIKQYKPKYNINLKDDKSYPYIVIKKEPFPRVFFSRRKTNNYDEYIGPLTSVMRARDVLNFTKQYVALRTCTLNLTEKNIQAKKFKVCLEFHLGNCKGPCEGLQTADDYNQDLQWLKNIIKGNLTPVINYYKSEIEKHSKNLAFEKAYQFKTKLEQLENYQAKSVIVNKKLQNIDVFNIAFEESTAFVNYLKVYNGSIIETQTIELNVPLQQSKEEVLIYAVSILREQFDSIANEIVIPFFINYTDANIKCSIPKIGDKKLLLELSQKNVQFFKDEIIRKRVNQQSNSVNNSIEETLLQIQKDLSLKEIPNHIECFDNSNFQGSFPVGAMVCFKNGLPSIKEHRTYHIKTVEGINDFASMKEIVFRRYRRLLNENKELPNLIIIDGGKGQLNAAIESLKELNIEQKVSIIGLAKNIEEIFFPSDKESIKLNWSSNSLNLIRKIRDAVHDYGISFHRNLRSKAFVKNELQSIKGIGNKTVEDLLQHFKSVKNIQSKTLIELEKIIDKKKALIIWRHFNNTSVVK
jgi:excinuclease ABC subunit C